MYIVLLIFSSASGAAKLNSYRPCMPSSSDADCTDHEVADSTSSDVLQELVMNAFELRKIEHKFLCETEIPNQVPCAKEPLKVRLFMTNDVSTSHVVYCTCKPIERVYEHSNLVVLFFLSKLGIL